MNSIACPDDGRIVTAGRTRQYRNVTLEGVRVRVASTEEDFSLAAELREAGFSRVSNRDSRACSSALWLDASDRRAGVLVLLGYDCAHKAVATLRVQDSRVGSVELQSRVDLSSAVSCSEWPVAQFSRLSSIKSARTTDVLFGLFKAAWHWCLVGGIETIVIATPPWSKPIYEFMCFQEFERSLRFRHELAGNVEHSCMKLPVHGAEAIWRAAHQPLCRQFFDMQHADLRI